MQINTWTGEYIFLRNEKKKRTHRIVKTAEELEMNYKSVVQELYTTV
jgi:hypothetical protein